MTSIRFKLLVALALAIALPASAQTLYKLIDKNGKVTYAEKPPKDFDGKVIRMDIDPNANTAVLPKPGAGEGGPTASPEAQQIRKGLQEANRNEKALERARQNLDAAKRALQSLIDNPGELDVMRMGTVGGGTRPVFTEDYQERIKNAEATVKAAEEEVARIEREAR
jgi:hypothetical protein